MRKLKQQTIYSYYRLEKRKRKRKERKDLIFFIVVLIAFLLAYGYVGRCDVLTGVHG